MAGIGSKGYDDDLKPSSVADGSISKSPHQKIDGIDNHLALILDVVDALTGSELGIPTWSVVISRLKIKDIGFP